MTTTETLQHYKFQLFGTAALVIGVYYPIIEGLFQQWYLDANYSHGFLVPLISAYFIYERWERLKKSPVSPWNPGLVVILSGLLLLIMGYLATEYFTMRSSLIVVLAGMALFFFGRAIFRQALLPIGYLIFMVPLPAIAYNAIAFPLKLFVTKVSVGFLQTVGIVVLRQGNIIMFPSLTLEVADACSGIRSLMSLLALGVAYAFLIPTSPLKRFILIAATIPIAIFTNAIRVIVTGILVQFWGVRVAEGFFHEFAGLMVFLLAIVIMAGIGVWFREEAHEER